MLKRINSSLIACIIAFSFYGVTAGNNNTLTPAPGNNGKWGFVNRSGHFVIKPKYDYAFNFSEGLALVYACNKFGYIDTEGNLLYRRVVFDKAHHFKEGLAAVAVRVNENIKWGYINATGEMVIKPQFDSAGDFRSGKAEVQLNGKKYFIDKEGIPIDG